MIEDVIVIDASVAIKWVLPEDDSEVAERLLGRYRLIAPHLIYAECANILWKAMRRGDITETNLMRATTFVDDFAIDTVSMRELVPQALDLALRLDHATYDCFYLALAILQDCRLVTADKKLLRKAQERLETKDAKRCVMFHALG